MEILDEIAVRIYLLNKLSSTKTRREQIVEAYREAEDFILTRAAYIDAPLDNLECSLGYKNHKYDDVGVCVRCGKKYNYNRGAAERMRKHQYRIRNKLIKDVKDGVS